MKLDKFGLLAILALFTCVYTASARKECRDRHRSCRQIGKKKPLNRCYRKHTLHECCATCRRLKIEIPDCEFGDKQKWCSSIGKRYSVASCYESKDDCCQTCHNLNTGIPGCPYGDKVQWCLHIGTIYGTDICATSGNVSCCETCHKINTQTTTTVLPTLQRESNTSGLPPGVHGHVVSSEEATKSHGDAEKSQPIPTLLSSEVTGHSAIMSQTISNAKSSNNNNDTSHTNMFSSSSQKPSSIPSLNEPQFPTQHSSSQTDLPPTERVSQFNKMAEFYVSITPSPRTTPSNVYNKNIKHIEDEPSPSSESTEQDEGNPNKDEIFVSIEENESDIDTSLGHNNDNRDHAQHPVDTEFEDFSRSDIDRLGGGILDTDDEDLLAGMGSGYFGHVGATSQHKERFAGDQHMGSAFSGTGHHNIYEQAEKDYVFEEYDVHGSSSIPQLSLILASLTQLIILLTGS